MGEKKVNSSTVSEASSLAAALVVGVDVHSVSFQNFAHFWLRLRCLSASWRSPLLCWLSHGVVCPTRQRFSLTKPSVSSTVSVGKVLEQEWNMHVTSECPLNAELTSPDVTLKLLRFSPRLYGLMGFVTILTSFCCLETEVFTYIVILTVYNSQLACG